MENKPKIIIDPKLPDAIFKVALEMKPPLPRPTYNFKELYWVHRLKSGEIRLVDEKGRVIEFRDDTDMKLWTEPRMLYEDEYGKKQ